jgi:hypothetical protein
MLGKSLYFHKYTGSAFNIDICFSPVSVPLKTGENTNEMMLQKRDIKDWLVPSSS